MFFCADRYLFLLLQKPRFRVRCVCPVGAALAYLESYLDVKSAARDSEDQKNSA